MLKNFVSALEGAFNALHISEVQDNAEAFVQKLAQAVFEEEIHRSHLREVGVRPTPSSLLTFILMQSHMPWLENSPIMPKKHAPLSLTLWKTLSQ